MGVEMKKPAQGGLGGYVDDTMFWAMLIKPFAAVAVLVAIYPIKRAIQVYMKDGKLKRLLLRRIS